MTGRVIVITSGKGGVGKTTTSANIGTALAKAGNKVVLIDTDIGLRNLDLLLGLENRIVYTIVDTFSDPSNPVLAQINDKITTVFDYGTASAMVWVYCLLILAILGLVFLLLKKLIVYEN